MKNEHTSSPCTWPGMDGSVTSSSGGGLESDWSHVSRLYNESTRQEMARPAEQVPMEMLSRIPSNVNRSSTDGYSEMESSDMETCRKRTVEKEGRERRERKDTWVEQQGGGGVFLQHGQCELTPGQGVL